MPSRIVLILLTIGAWIVFKAIDTFMPFPATLTLLGFIFVILVLHSVKMLTAQSSWRRRLRKSGKESEEAIDSESTWHPAVDIFIPAKNEAKVIAKTVGNLFKIDYPNYKVWVIDDNSDDSTYEVLANLKKDMPNLEIVRRGPNSIPGKSAGLNEALAISRGEVVCVFDADAYVDPNFLKLVIPVLEPEEVGAVQAQKKIYEYQSGFIIDCQSAEYAVDTYFQMGRDLIGGVVELRGNGQLVKRQALIDVGGWNNKTITDDLDLTMRLLINHYDIRFIPHAVVWEEGVPTWPGLVRQRKRWAEGSIRRYLDYILPLNSPSRLSIVERLDIFVFVTEFTVPALVGMELISEIIALLSGNPTHGLFFVALVSAIYMVTVVNFCVGIKMYKKLGLLATIGTGIIFSFYIYILWTPQLLDSFFRIVFLRGSSKWHRTEHIGVAE